MQGLVNVSYVLGALGAALIVAAVLMGLLMLCGLTMQIKGARRRSR